MRDVPHVALFGNIQISTQAIQALCEQEVPVAYFSIGGWFYGINRGPSLKNVFLRMEQFRLPRDEMMRLSVARQFVHGKIRNHRTLLMRNHLELPEAIIEKLKRASEDVGTPMEWYRAIKPKADLIEKSVEIRLANRRVKSCAHFNQVSVRGRTWETRRNLLSLARQIS